MKIIHTADIHLDSPLVGVADSAMRRTELLRAFANMSAFADNSGVEAIIVAGDLFDEQYVSPATVAAVADVINGSRAQWFLLRGNHGSAAPYAALQQQCPKVKTFGDDWTTYTMGNVCICGRELGNNDSAQWQRLSLNPANYNVLVLHGDVDDPAYGLIDKKVISALPLQYVALGHRHTFAEHKFGRVRGAYCGVLETRGFDEASDTGFVLLDTSANTVKFVPQHLRRVQTVQVDISSVTNDLALEKTVLDAVSAADVRNYLNVELVGTACSDVRVEAVTRNALEGKFFSLRVKNCTKSALDIAKLQQEVSLRGEFVKLALAIENPEERAAVLELGLRALNGEV